MTRGMSVVALSFFLSALYRGSPRHYQAEAKPKILRRHRRSPFHPFSQDRRPRVDFLQTSLRLRPPISSNPARQAARLYF